ncbi:MAG: hypothetical protein RJA09_625 [Pseudomonadota bacterium]|jgi:protein-L-isoaspartate(D-aspartate) O-methyltransferase
MSSNSPAFDFDKARFNMIEQQIRPWEVLDVQVLHLLSVIRREDFVPPAYKHLAFVDMEIPLGALEGERMLAPKVEARALQDLALQATDKVLEIGTGSGYMAALLASQCAHVTTLEINPSLAQAASHNLAQAGITNAEVRTTDAAAHRFSACNADAPYDAIVLSGSVADIPADLLDLLKDGGRLFAITGQEPVMRASLVRRTGPAAFHTVQPWDTVAARLRNMPQPTGFRF